MKESKGKMRLKVKKINRSLFRLGAAEHKANAKKRELGYDFEKDLSMKKDFDKDIKKKRFKRKKA